MTKNITVIGTDSTHCVAFARLLMADASPWKITAAVRDVRSQMSLSQSRYQQIEQDMGRLGVTVFETLTPDLEATTDAFIIASVDGSLHLSQYQQLAKFGKPIFIDKPITYDRVEMEQLFEVAETYGLEVMSSSSLRFSESVLEVKAQLRAQPLEIDLWGPLPLEPEIPGLFWYGIHLVELLLTIWPQPFQVEQVVKTAEDLLITCRSNQTLCRITGNLSGQGAFRGQLKSFNQELSFNQESDQEPLYAYLVKEMLGYFETGNSPVSKAETRAVMALVEKINQEVLDDYIPKS